jgi:hypothetical protein
MEFEDAVRRCVGAMGPDVVRDSRRFVSCLLDYADDSLALRAAARNLDDAALAPFVEALGVGGSLTLATSRAEVILRDGRGLNEAIAHHIASAVGAALQGSSGVAAGVHEREAAGQEATNGAKPYRFDRGFLHPAFASNGENGIVELTNPSIMVTDAILTFPDDVTAVMAALWRAAGPTKPPFLLIARDANEKTLKKLVSFNERGFPVWAVKAPGYGDRCRETLVDIATVTGGSIFSAIPGAEYSRNAFGRIAAGELGHAEVVRVSADSTCIYGGAGSEIAVLQRMEMISREIGAALSDYDREKLEERFDALAGQVTGRPSNRSSNAKTTGREAQTGQTPAASAAWESGRQPHTAVDSDELRSFVAKVAGRAGQTAPWVPELGCFQVQSTARILAHKMRTYFMIKHDDNATAEDFDAFSHACARWVRSNKEFNNNMVVYPVLLQAHARHDVVDYAKQAPPGFLQDPCISTLPTVVDLSTGDVQYMDASPTVGLLMWKGVRKAAMEALG